VSYQNLCPSCIEKMEEKFQVAKKYIEDNPNANIDEVSEECDVSIRQLEKWVREERLAFTKDSAIGIPCERCGASISSGRFCNECRDKMSKTLGSVYAARAEQKAGNFQSAKMRYIKND